MLRGDGDDDDSGDVVVVVVMVVEKYESVQFCLTVVIMLEWILVELLDSWKWCLLLSFVI